MGAALDQLGQWEQDTRKVILDTLGVWMQQQSANVVAAVNKHIDEKLAALPVGEVGTASGVALTEEQITAIVEAVINKVKLST